MSRAEFEAWYATHAFNYERDPIGSRDCGLQWAAWKAATERAAQLCEQWDATHPHRLAAQSGESNA